MPVSDVDRAKDFYAGKMGFHVDIDNTVGERMRVVQLTPPGSAACSITLGRGFVDMSPGSLKGLQLVVGDLASARGELLARGVQVSEVRKALARYRVTGIRLQNGCRPTRHRLSRSLFGRSALLRLPSRVDDAGETRDPGKTGAVGVDDEEVGA